MTRRVARSVLLAVAVAAGGGVRARAAAAQTSPLTVRDAARLSLEHHPLMRVARAGRDDATAAVGVARSARLPGASAEASLTRFQEPMIVAPLHRFDIGTPPQFANALIQSQVSVAYTLFDGGRRRALLGQATAAEASAEARVSAAQMAVIDEVTTAYLEGLTAAGIDDANRLGVQALEAERGRTTQLLSEGRAARVELLRVEAALAEARADRIASQSALQSALRILARLIGTAADSLSEDRLVVVALGARPLEESSTTRAKTSNPDLRSARQRAVAERAAASAARSEWFPSIRLRAGYVTFGSAGGNFSAEWQGGVALSYPLFTAGGRGNRNARASARAVRAEEEVRLTEMQIDTAVDRALARLRESSGRVAALATAVDHLIEVARIEQLALSAGVGVQTDYLTAEANLARARAGLVRARHAEIAARVALARLTGDLSVEWLAENLEEGS